MQIAPSERSQPQLSQAAENRAGAIKYIAIPNVKNTQILKRSLIETFSIAELPPLQLNKGLNSHQQK